MSDRRSLEGAKIVAPDAILVPSGNTTSDGRPLPWIAERFDAAAAVHHALGGLVMPLGRGTVHKPPFLDAAGFPIDESVAGARYLVEDHGVEPSAILPEAMSLETVGNAAFARLLIEPQPNLRNLLVVTSELLMDRTKWIFEHVFGLTPGADRYSLQFLGTPNTGLGFEEQGARGEKEKFALDKAQGRFGQISTMAEFLTWLFTEHGVYSTAGKARQQPVLSEEVLRTY
jgi:hypothetical protein